MEKNTAGKWTVFAYGDPNHATLAGLPITGDAANITANIRIDGGAANAVDDTNPTELEDGYYVFDITAAEANGDLISMHPASATANVLVIGVPGAIYTRPANFNDLSITATTGLTSSNVTQWAGTATTLSSTTSKPQIDVFSVSDDATAADNLELQYDGTGLIGDNFPSTQTQVGLLAVGSAAISTIAESQVLTTGTEVNSYAVTDEVDGVYHEISDAAGAMELYYQYDIGPDGVASEVAMIGRLEGGNDLIGVYAYNWIGATWDQIGSLQGSGSTADGTSIFNLLTRHTGIGANLGKVRVRGYAASGLTTSTLYIDQSYVSYAYVPVSRQTKGTISDTTPTALNFDTDLTKADGIFDDALLIMTSGAQADASAPITTYLNANGNIALGEALPSAPANGDSFIIYHTHIHPVSEIQSGLSTLIATDIVSAGPITTSAGAIVNVDTVDVCTSNTDMRGTDSANTVAPDNTSITAILADTADMQPRIGTMETDVNNLDLGIIYGTAATGTLTTTSATTNLTGYADNQLTGAYIVVTSGAAEGERRAITAYTEIGGVIEFAAMTIAMANNDTFKIV